MNPYKSLFTEAPAAPTTTTPLPTSNPKVVNSNVKVAPGNAKQTVQANKTQKISQADTKNSPSKLFRNAVGKTIFDPKNGVMLIFSQEGIKIANVKSNKVVADLSFNDLKFKT
jgi:hypothetical protein